MLVLPICISYKKHSALYHSVTLGGQYVIGTCLLIFALGRLRYCSPSLRGNI